MGWGEIPIPFCLNMKTSITVGLTRPGPVPYSTTKIEITESLAEGEDFQEACDRVALECEEWIRRHNKEERERMSAKTNGSKIPDFVF